MARILKYAFLALGLAVAACGGGGDDRETALSTQQEIPASMRGVAAKQLFGAQQSFAAMSPAPCQASSLGVPTSRPASS